MAGFTTFAVAVIVMIAGLGPQLKVMTPPLATALTTAAEVQLAGVPVPMTWFGSLVTTASPAGGTRRMAGWVAEVRHRASRCRQ